jgi:hypothetical protein
MAATPFIYTLGGRRRVKSALGTFQAPPAAAPRAAWPVPYQAPTAAAWGGMLARPAATAAGAPGAPADPSAVQVAGNQAPPDFTGDAGYAAAIARLGYNRDTGIADIQQQGAYDQTDTAEALRRLGERQVQDTQDSKENANKQGLLLSGYLGKKLGDLQVGYDRSRGDAQQAFDRREAARQAAIRGDDSQYVLGQGDAQADAITRMLTADQADADAGILATQQAPAPAAAAAPTAAAAAVPAAGSSSKTKTKRGRLIAVKGTGAGYVPARRRAAYQAPRSPAFGAAHTGSF